MVFRLKAVLRTGADIPFVVPALAGFGFENRSCAVFRLKAVLRTDADIPFERRDDEHFWRMLHLPHVALAVIDSANSNATDAIGFKLEIGLFFRNDREPRWNVLLE